ncbi:Protein CBG06483 [Caenorhabditis briggsae]|uniref:Protein CBG06483 n=1 Tax=Caenorhabditis briggsae TaxID=6238 RepID=A8X2B9_CAEBR|nr:Protein CBG06483 [Caenorhabditis briggsae]CAP26779.1 Protein CBG06483 [Caenorhabditis briggsae]
MSAEIPDLRIYATVFYSDRSLQYRATVFVYLLATQLNFLLLYLIWAQSKPERVSIKVLPFWYHMSLYSCEVQLGVFGGMVTLYPFAAAYSQEVQRKKSTYFYIYIFLAIFIYFPVPLAMFSNYSTPQEMENFVRIKYPNNLQILDHPGFFIFTNSKNERLTYFGLFGSVAFILLMITLIYASMYLETKQNASNVQSFGNIKERLKGLQNFVTQSIIMCSLTTISTILNLQTIFNDPSEDSRIQNLFAYSFLCGTTIPAQLSMIWRNPA